MFTSVIINVLYNTMIKKGQPARGQSETLHIPPLDDKQQYDSICHRVRGHMQITFASCIVLVVLVEHDSHSRSVKYTVSKYPELLEIDRTIQGQTNSFQGRFLRYGLKTGRAASSFIALGTTTNKPNYTIHHGIDKKK